MPDVQAGNVVIKVIVLAPGILQYVDATVTQTALMANVVTMALVNHVAEMASVKVMKIVQIVRMMFPVKVDHVVINHQENA